MTIIQFPKGESSRNASPGPIILTLPVARQPFCRLRFVQPEPQARAIPPDGALKWLAENMQQGAPITGVDLDGPGDPLAEMESTLETLKLLGGNYPELKLSLTTLGLQAEEYAQPLAKAGVCRVNLLVDAVSQDVAAKLYAWIRPGRKTVPLSQAVPMLLGEQFRAAMAFKEADCSVTIRTTVYPGINDGHVAEIARHMAAGGAEAMHLVPCSASAGQEEQETIAPPGLDLMQRVWADAVGHLPTTIVAARENRLGIDYPSLLGDCRSPPMMNPKPTKERPNLAVVSMSGMEVDLHLGQAYHVLVYGPREDGLTCLLGTRPMPDPASGSGRWQELAATLNDCFAILAASAGESPRRILGEKGITVLIIEGEIEGLVDSLYGGGKNKRGKGQV